MSNYLNDIKIEQSVIGAMLIDKSCVYIAIELLNEDVFSSEKNKCVFTAIKSLFSDNLGIDILTVSDVLKKQKKLDFIGGDFHLIELSQIVSSSAHIEYHGRILLELYIKRECIKASQGIIDLSKSDDSKSLDVLDQAFSRLTNVCDLIDLGKSVDFEKEVIDFLTSIDTKQVSVKGSLSKFNQISGGYFDTDLVIIGARPGMGKTALIINEMLAMAFSGVSVVFFSLEMSTKQVIGRFLSIMSGIPSGNIKKGNLSQSEREILFQCVEILSKLPIQIDDTASLTPIQMKLKMAKIKREKGVQIAFVDYLQLMKEPKASNREQEISMISVDLKAMAKEFNIPVVALSQLSRSVETRGGSKRPLLSDLRDSGMIEQAANVVIFIFRPEYYGITEWDDDTHSPCEGEAELDIAKNREGETGYVRVKAELKYMLFYDYEMHISEAVNRYLNRESPMLPESKITPQSTDLAF